MLNPSVSKPLRSDNGKVFKWLIHNLKGIILLFLP
jgi:hypothetical protein